ncbi:MAG: 50S ribosomal protein L19, partial [Candidatus Magasanikbacteria bacterium]
MDKEKMSQIKPGARVKVWQKIKEGGEKRETPFEGIVIARKHGSEQGATFTVRNTIQNVGVEKIFPIHAPTIRVEILKSPDEVKRSKMYFLRDMNP